MEQRQTQEGLYQGSSREPSYVKGGEYSSSGDRFQKDQVGSFQISALLCTHVEKGSIWPYLVFIRIATA